MTPPIVKRFLISLDQHKLLGFFSFAFIVLGSGVFALQPPPPPPAPIHKASGVLAFKPQPPAFTSTGQQLQEQGRSINKGILLAPTVLIRVSQKAKINPQQIQEILNKQLKVKFPEEGKAQVIFLEYIDKKNPQQAESILGAFMAEMVEESRLINTSQLRTKITALNKRLSQVQTELKQAEEKFYRYISTEVSTLLAVQDGTLFSGITSSQQQQRDIQVALEGLEAEINSLVNQLRMTPEQAYTSSALSADPILANLRAQILQNESQLEILGRERRVQHPEVVRLLKEKQANEQLLQQRAVEVIGSDGILTALTPAQIRRTSNLDPARRELANRLVTLNSEREGLFKQLTFVKNAELELRQQYERFPEKQLEQARLLQAVESKRALYQNILAVLVDAQSAEAETIGSLEIAQDPIGKTEIEKPQPPISPLVIISAGAGLGFVAAAGLIFLLSTLDARLHTSKELRSALSDREVLLLGELPFIASFDATGRETPILLDADSIYLPAYERFRSNIRRIGSESSKVILITSIIDEEGKTVSAYNLAIAIAHTGKRTLLVEADLRSSSQIQSLNLDPDLDANIEPLGYYAARNESIRLVPEVANLSVISSPGPQRQPAAIIESSELQILLNEARRRFDMVIIDTPSISSCNDALLLEPLTDGIILVTRPGFTDGNLLAETIDQLTEAELPLLGAVINGVEKSIPFPQRFSEETETEFDESEDFIIEDGEEIVTHR